MGKLHLHKSFWGILLLFTGAAQAETVTLTFDLFWSNTDQAHTYSGTQHVIEDGYYVIPDSGNFGYLGSLHPYYAGSPSIYNRTNGGGTNLAALSGDAFNLHSMGLSKLVPEGTSMMFTGFFSGGGSISQEVSFGESSPYAYETVFFTGFDNLISVEWDPLNSSAPIQFDNIVLSTVPIPAAFWLFGSALGILSWMRQKIA